MTDTATGRVVTAPRPDRPLLVAHRGAPRIERENTVASIRAGARAADLVEVDLRHTRDGVAVVVHDATLDRLWGDPRTIADLSWAEVEAIGGVDGIPRLDAVLDLAARERIPLLLDMTTPADARAGVAAVLAAAALPELAWCGDPGAMEEVRSAIPDADIWLEWVALRPPSDADLAALEPSTVNLDIAFLTPAIVDDAHRRGLRVAVWTVDDAAPARWAAGLGVDSITTNDVDAVVSGLEGAGADPGDLDARAHELAMSVAREIIAFTREHPIEEVSTKKHDADLVTDVDRLVEQHVRGRVRQVFPEHGFTGEEFGDAPGDGRTWYLDPVDGTTNLVNGIPWTSMSLCLARDDDPVVGVVADPWRGEVLDARRGRGARTTLDTRARALRLDPADPVSLVGATVGTELAGHRPWPGLTRLLDALAARSCTLRIMGSGTLTLAQVAAGRGIGACVSSFDPIDHGAAVLLVQEAGGVVTSPTGRRSGFPERGEPVLVAHPAIADELEAIWRRTALRSA